MRIMLWGCVMAMIFGCATRIPEEAASLLVDHVDLERYAGLWYQVGRYPHSFQRRPCGDSTAEYAIRENGSISVLNRCWEEEYGGAYTQQVKATARPVNESGSWLRVKFFGIFPAGYLIIELDQEHYQWAAVTTPDRKSLWILSRTSSLEPDVYDMIVASLEKKGFDPDLIIKTSQQPHAGM